MAHLNIKLDTIIETENLMVQSCKILKGSKAAEYFAKCSRDDLAMFVVAVNPADHKAEISFEFGAHSLKKGAILDLSWNESNTGLTAKIFGQFSVKLRAGVISSLPAGVLFKLQGICYKGGSYRGFMSYLAGQDENNIDSWYLIKEAVIN